MDNYKIIQDEFKFKEFIDWLPELKDNEKYFISLFARKKYCEDLIKSNDKTQLKRFTSNKQDIFHKVKQLECEIGSYRLKDRIAPQASLVLYINPNPRNMITATYKLMKKAVDLIQMGTNYNIHAEALSAIQSSKSKTHFCDFDIDNKDIDFSYLTNIFPNKEAYTIIETRGGYHLLVNVNIAPEHNWYIDIKKFYKDIDNIGDQLLPTPGCTQGGYIPNFKHKGLS